MKGLRRIVAKSHFYCGRCISVIFRGETCWVRLVPFGGYVREEFICYVCRKNDPSYTYEYQGFKKVGRLIYVTTKRFGTIVVKTSLTDDPIPQDVPVVRPYNGYVFSLKEGRFEPLNQQAVVFAAEMKLLGVKEIKF